MHRFFLLTILFYATGISILGCHTSDDNTRNNSNFDERKSPRISLSSASLHFTNSQIGHTDTTTLTISNTGSNRLDIHQMELVEDDTDNVQEFFPGANWQTSLHLDVGQSQTISVVYRPLNAIEETGLIRLTTNDPLAPIVEVPIHTEAFTPEIFAPSQIRFDRTPSGTAAQQTIEIHNLGQIPLRIDDVFIENDHGFELVHDDSLVDENAYLLSDTIIYPSEIKYLSVTFAPQSDYPLTDNLYILSNDPHTPDHLILLSGNTNTTCARFSHDAQLDFGASSIHNPTRRSFAIQNCSTTKALNIDNLNIESPDSSFELANGSLIQNIPAILPGEQYAVDIVFTPREETRYDGLLTVETDDPTRERFELPLFGTGTQNQCPIAIAEVNLNGNAPTRHELTILPLSTVELTALNSVDPDGTIDSYQWTILSSPEDSQSRLLPSPQAPQTSLFLDVAGTYKVELTVFDQQAMANCLSEIFVIHAYPEDDIHIQLTWRTPGAGTPSQDYYGADLDLHYRHEVGYWNQAPYDIFWANPTANWADPQESGDNPRLAFDHRWDAGPENINHSGLEDDTRYHIGVYYFADNGWGPSYATVRIYIDGELRFERLHKYMPSQGYFWDVATISWPAQEIYKHDLIEFGFPQP